MKSPLQVDHLREEVSLRFGGKETLDLECTPRSIFNLLVSNQSDCI